MMGSMEEVLSQLEITAYPYARQEGPDRQVRGQAAWPLERHSYKRHSTAWQEQAQRRFSLAHATIRAVTPDFSLEELAAKSPFIDATYEVPTSSSEGIPVAQEKGTVAGPDATPRTALDGGDPSEQGAREFFVRSRTKTLGDPSRTQPPPRPVSLQTRQRLHSDTAIPSLHSLGSNKPARSTRELSQPERSVSAITPSVKQASYAAPDVRRLQRNRHRRVKSPANANPASGGAIIKVGKLMYWDNSALLEKSNSRPRVSTLTRRTKVWKGSWRGISGVLRENGELKLYDETDVSLLATVQLSMLPRCAIQQLHGSVLQERFCIAVYPQYALSSGAVSPARPVYISMDSRILFEAWFVLLRAFAIPELYGPDQALRGPDLDVASDLEDEPRPPVQDLFRLERSVFIRIIEARLRHPRPRTMPEGTTWTQLGQMPREDLTSGDYFSEVVIDGATKARTMPRDNKNDLFWREEFDFTEIPRALSSSSVLLKKENSKASDSKSSFAAPEDVASSGKGAVTCGEVAIDFESVRHDQAKEALYPILNEQEEVIGEMLLKIRAEELVVLMLHEYQVLSDMLHDVSRGLTSQIARMMPTNLQRLSEILVNIFQVTGRVSPWLMAVAKDEIDGKYQSSAAARTGSGNRTGSSGSHESPGERDQVFFEFGRSIAAEVSLLFRGNSLLTRSLDIHMRRVGKEYLEELLSGIIAEINADNLDCEIDPGRISAAGELTAHWRQFIKYFRMVWKAIYESIARCPREMRLLLQYIRTCCEERFGVFHHTVRYSSVSGFLFLRFFCPAVLNPKLFGLLPDHPRPRAQRTLTLIAKSLQGLANMTSFGVKESWMEPMNNHLVIHRQEFREFIDSLCSISPDPHGQTTPASYATPITIFARLPPTHREGFPSLPYLIDEALNYALLVNLWLDSGPDRKGFNNPADADLVRFHDECVHLRQRTVECVMKAEQSKPTARPTSLPPLSPPPRLESPSRPSKIPGNNSTTESLPFLNSGSSSMMSGDVVLHERRFNNDDDENMVLLGSPRTDNNTPRTPPSSSSSSSSITLPNSAGITKQKLFSDLVTLGFRRRGK